MKDHYIRLFDYDAYANRLITGLILQADDKGFPTRLMAHVFAAQQRWLSRCNGFLFNSDELWPTWEAGTFEKIIANNHRDWVSYLESLQPNNFENLISYQNTKGEIFNNTVTDILTQIINHGTHHRAQVGQHLKLNGSDLPPTDYIAYIREQKQ